MPPRRLCARSCWTRARTLRRSSEVAERVGRARRSVKLERERKPGIDVRKRKEGEEEVGRTPRAEALSCTSASA